MKNPFSKVPFLFLLIPLIVGILFQYYIRSYFLSIAFFLTGITAIFFSYYIVSEKKQFRWRWLFGVGVCLFVIGIGIVSTSFCQVRSEFAFSDEAKIYRAIVTNIPEEKPRSIAYKVYLPDEDKQLICYFQKDSLSGNLLDPGDEFIFYGKVQPFKNLGNPDDFNYERYMYNQGYAGSSYVYSQAWKLTGMTVSSLKSKALNIRQKLLDFYQSLGFNETEYSVLSALTLGYKNTLTDDLKQSFRTTGTIHVLSVSGLHVGVIYLMINFLLSFIRRGTKFYFLKPLSVIVLLWGYAFITGLPISVVRASTMLTIFCIADIFGKKSFSIHALFITAFVILLYNPFALFDIGFQLSFMSVLGILYLQPKASGLLTVENKYMRRIWQMFTLSCVAQLATFPICLYYFGTFPTYFFITNLLIVPLVSVIIYAVLGIVFAGLFSQLLPAYECYFYYVPVKLLQLLVHVMTSIIRFFENLPFALVDNIKISFLDLAFILAIIISVLIFLIYKKSKSLVIAMFMVFILLLGRFHNNINSKPDSLIVYNRPYYTEIRWRVNKMETILKKQDIVDGFRLIELNENKTLVLSAEIWKGKETNRLFEIDNLVLTNDDTFSLYSLTKLVSVKNVILDASLSVYTRTRLTKECQKLNIPCHDVVTSGAFTLNF